MRYLTLTSATHGDVGFPKGHTEPGEDELTTALRETHEETGIEARPNAWFRRSIRYEALGAEKEAVYLLATCDSDAVTLSNEHSGADWLDLDETLAALRHDALRTVVADAAAYLKDPILRRGLTPADARAILVEHVGADAPVVGHTAQVAAVARACAEAWPGLDADYVEAAAWLHDIGRAKTHGLRHPLEGFRIVSAAGHPGYAPPCLSHYSKGCSAEELRLDAELAQEMWEACDLDTFATEERVIAMADFMAVGDRRGTFEERHADLVARYGASGFFDLTRNAAQTIREEFEARTGADLYALVLS